MYKMKKAKSLQKPPPMVAPTPQARDSDTDVLFELELCWCVQQLENALNTGKLSQKVAEDTAKNLKTLKSHTAPLIKKRQVMKAAFGDYRSKMKDEEKKMALAAKQIKFTNPSDANKKSSFVKKSAILTSGNDFRFNFNLTDNEKLKQEQETNELQKETQASDNFVKKDIQFAGETFKFNFQIEEDNESFNFSDLSIKN